MFLIFRLKIKIMNMRLPILLSRPDSIRDDVLSFIGNTPVIIAGGTSSISKEVENQLANVKARMAGSDRYETSLQIAKAAFNDQNTLYLTNGNISIDALAAGAILEEQNALLLLINPNRVDVNQLTFIKESKFENIVFIGGENTLSKEFKDLMKVMVE